MSALVVEHHPHLRTPLLGQPCPLKVEGSHAQTEAVREYHGQRSVFGSDLADRQRHPVGGGHHAAAVDVQQLEILAGVGIVGGDPPAHGPGDRHARDRADRGQPGGPRQPACVRLRPRCLASLSLNDFGLSPGSRGTSW